jgi:hypothetical protein
VFSEGFLEGFSLCFTEGFSFVYGRFFTQNLGRVIGRMFTRFLKGFSFSAETSYHWQKLAFYNTSAKNRG